MTFTKTPFEGLFILEPKVFQDNRGHFLEAFNGKTFQEFGIPFQVVQENQSHSIRHVIRGLHFQKPPHAQVKLVRVLQGVILDVVVDLRRDQPTYGKVYSIELSAENRKGIFVPSGFAHGFSVLSPSADVIYLCDHYYRPDCEGGVAYNDPDLQIDWGFKTELAIVSGKDVSLPWFASLPAIF